MKIARRSNAKLIIQGGHFYQGSSRQCRFSAGCYGRRKLMDGCCCVPTLQDTRDELHALLCTTALLLSASTATSTNEFSPHPFHAAGRSEVHSLGSLADSILQAVSSFGWVVSICQRSFSLAVVRITLLVWWRAICTNSLEGISSENLEGG